jgi:hypothetical protein
MTVAATASTVRGLAPRREEHMTHPVIGELERWWGARRPADFVAQEIVGPLGIADLVAARFDEGALAARRAAGIAATDDLLALRVILECRRAARTTSDLAAMLGFSLSGVRRAVRVACDIGALWQEGARRHRTHPAWRPAARRLVAVELKRTDWRRAADQAWAYQGWANATWLVLGQCPTEAALGAMSSAGVGLGYLGEDRRVHVLTRPRSRRGLTGVPSVWAGEQMVVRAIAAGLGTARDVRPSSSRLGAPLAGLAG